MAGLNRFAGGSVGRITRPFRAIGNFFRWLTGECLRLYRPIRYGRELKFVQNNSGQIKKSDILLVTCLRNELVRLPFFLDYYRKLGVNHFLIIDNDSTDELRTWIKQFNDCSVWHTKASYLKSAFGMQWCNYLLRKYGTGHLCVTVDPDEFLVYPYMETRGLRDLGIFLKDDERDTMHALLIDAYGEGSLGDTLYSSGDSPFEVCPQFDRDGYIQTSGFGDNTTIRGGPRMRMLYADNPGSAPVLNKIPLVWWKWNYTYRSSMHDAMPKRLNRAHTPGEVSVTGCLFHFKLMSILIDKAEEESVRNQHYDSGSEYRRYRTARDVRAFAPGISIAFKSPQQLVELGLMSPGSWV